MFSKSGSIFFCQPCSGAQTFSSVVAEYDDEDEFVLHDVLHFLKPYTHDDYELPEVPTINNLRYRLLSCDVMENVFVATAPPRTNPPSAIMHWGDSGLPDYGRRVAVARGGAVGRGVAVGRGGVAVGRAVAVGLGCTGTATVMTRLIALRPRASLATT